VSAISYYLEREGIMTTGISLVRENTLSMQPPRALWVPFPLGRPLGVPNDPGFQHRVIAAALDLLDRPTGPVLEDFPEEAPVVDIEFAAACPVSFAQPKQNDTWQGRLNNEFMTLRPWHDLSLRRRAGRTLTGLSEHSVEENLSKLGKMLDAGQLPSSEFRWLKFAIEDAKAFYIEALTAQPGDYVQEELHRTLWQDTQLGHALRTCHQILDSEPRTRLFAGIVVPRQALEGQTIENALPTHPPPPGDHA
jgi:D-proline reductase (dithiol) PrdB